MNESIISSGAFTPSNYVGTRRPEKFSKRLGVLLRRPLPPVTIYPKEFKNKKGAARYFPAPTL